MIHMWFCVYFPSFCGEGGDNFHVLIEYQNMYSSSYIFAHSKGKHDKALVGVSETLIEIHVRCVVTIYMGLNKNKDKIFKILGEKHVADMLFQHFSCWNLSTKEF